MVNFKHRIKTQIVYELIRDDIISGLLPPGSKVTIDALAIRYEVSHSPIRECLRLLEAKGFVTIRPYAGITVTNIRPELIIEAFYILESLEIISSCSASHNATEEQLKQLDALIIEMEGDLDSPEDWFQKNILFHMVMCDIGNMTISKSLMHQTLLHWNRLRRYYLEQISYNQLSRHQQKHAVILIAMKSQDDQHITDVIRQHNKDTLKDYLMFIKKIHKVDLLDSIMD